jgi:hypothetical protein
MHEGIVARYIVFFGMDSRGHIFKFCKHFPVIQVIPVLIRFRDSEPLATPDV